jgi:PAS domain S-box-containing protein
LEEGKPEVGEGIIMMTQDSILDNTATGKTDWEEEQAYMHLFVCNPQPMWVYDLETLRFLAVNTSIVNEYGYSREEFLGMTIEQIYPAEDRAAVVEAVRGMKGERRKAGGWRHVKKDGTVIDTEITTHDLNFQGRNARLVLALDVTSHRQVEMALHKAIAALAEEKAKSEAIIESLGESIVIQDTNHIVIYQNRKHRGLMGNCVGETCYRVFGGYDGPCAECPVAMSFADGATHKVVRAVPGSQGMTYVELTATSLRDAAGKIIAGVKVVRDITEQKRVEAEIQRLASFMQLNPNPILELDASGKVILCNKATIDMLERLGIGSGVAVFIPEGLEEILENLREGKQGQYYREISICGRVVAEHIYLTPQFNSIRIYVDDITDRRKVEQTLNLKHLQLEELNRSLEKRVREELSKNRKKDHILIQQTRQAAMGEMIGNIAHQWRQPLTVVALIIQDLAECYTYGEFTKEYLHASIDKAMEVIQHMSQTIDDFRSCFRPDKEKKVFSIQDVIGKAISLIEPHLKHHDFTVELEMDDDCFCYGYLNEFSQVLLNILTNAKEVFLERGTPQPCIRVRTFQEADRAVVIIADNAGGIAKKVIGKVFEPYFTTKDMGTGIGLYMSKNIIEKNMHGRLTVANIDMGAEFRIEVPCTPPPHDN